MFSSFDITRPAPSVQDILRWRDDVARAVRCAVFTMAIGVLAACGELAQGVLTGGASLDLPSIATVVAGTAAFALARRYFRKFVWEQSELKVVPLEPMQILEAFVLTADSRRYGTEVVNQKRGLTLAELMLVSMYCEEFHVLVKSLSPEQALALHAKVGTAISS